MDGCMCKMSLSPWKLLLITCSDQDRGPTGCAEAPSHGVAGERRGDKASTIYNQSLVPLGQRVAEKL